MKFGLIYEICRPDPEWATEEEIYWQALEQCVLAEEVGFDYIWEVEHHFLEGYSLSSAPEVFLSAVAARRAAQADPGSASAAVDGVHAAVELRDRRRLRHRRARVRCRRAGRRRRLGAQVQGEDRQPHAAGRVVRQQRDSAGDDVVLR